MLIVLFLLLAFRLLGFFLKVAGGIIKIIFRILIFPVLIITALRGHLILAIVTGAIVIMVWSIEGAVKRKK
ncbi:MAG: hypothetical protein IJ796_00035 [Lachnospiraceae bacterium]|nr:hypothetical protein [Lachnospiraceae bacterium]